MSRKPPKYKYICLCGNQVWSDKNNMLILCDNHSDLPRFPKFVGMKTMEMCGETKDE